MKIVVEAANLLVTEIRKINEGQNFISGKQYYYWVLIYYVIYYMLPDKNFVGITLQNNQTFSDWQQYQRSCKIYASTLLSYKNMNSIIKRLPLLTKLRYI